MPARVKAEIRRILDEAAVPAPDEYERPVPAPRVVLVVGVNGTGKTTTVGKLAHRCRAEGGSPLICAADTFRAAAGRAGGGVGRSGEGSMSCGQALARTRPRSCSTR